MHPKSNRKLLRKRKNLEPARKLDENLAERQVAGVGKDELASAPDPERTLIFLAACRIVISGYKAEISRTDGNGNSLFVRAAYEVLHRFLEQEFSRPSRAA
jgi:hypothetical protein